MEVRKLFRELLNVLNSAAEANLPGWSIEEMKYWKSAAGIEYMEVRIHVSEEELFVRLKSDGPSVRVAGVKLYTKRELSRRKDSDVESQGIDPK